MALMRNMIPDNILREGRVSFIYNSRPSDLYYTKLAFFGVTLPVSDHDKAMPAFDDLLNYCRLNFKGYIYYVEYQSNKVWILEFFFKNPSDAVALKLRWG